MLECDKDYGKKGTMGELYMHRPEKNIPEEGHRQYKHCKEEACLDWLRFSKEVAVANTGAKWSMVRDSVGCGAGCKLL